MRAVVKHELLAVLCIDRPRSHGECAGASTDKPGHGRGQETQVLDRGIVVLRPRCALTGPVGC